MVKTLYVSKADSNVWQAAIAEATANGQSLSELITQTLRERVYGHSFTDCCITCDHSQPRYDRYGDICRYRPSNLSRTGIVELSAVEYASAVAKYAR